MTFSILRGRRAPALAFLVLTVAGVAVTVQHLRAQGSPEPAPALAASFNATARPFLEQNCMGCHRGDAAIAGLRVDGLNGALEDQQMETWERVYARVANGTMPPANARQPAN